MPGLKIDVHNHVGRWLSDDGDWLTTAEDVLATMDAAGIATLVNLDGRWGSELTDNLARYDAAHPGRFLTFCQADWSLLDTPGALTAQLSESAAAGARGLKIWKDLGLSVRDQSGRLVAPDDPRVVELCRAAGDLGLPVLIHTADPVAFFEPLDETNERIDELTAVPEWWFGGPDHPTFAALLAALHRLVGACPATTFIGAHVGCQAEDLDAVGSALQRLPNWHVDTGGRLAEIGRRPAAFRRLVETFPDRILFGSDCYPPKLSEYDRWWRFLETADQDFSYVDDGDVPLQGRWRISGCDLPATLLPALYRHNAQRVLGCGAAYGLTTFG
ncbi:amidohydrolase family protein [Nocardioides mangrovi]|uniref:Amidohydrolase family protein n=1 Tax=Nocardioides mangrovi TaxID=2874580 RepID=A0ABS7UCJ4_9ACTN|nr:amidohydrolase family protein [Nocardioides mangrovi]MBZ5738728.1 amidohydrolase family protein [Nocardioides mangrovi]